MFDGSIWVATVLVLLIPWLLWFAKLHLDELDGQFPLNGALRESSTESTCQQKVESASEPSEDVKREKESDIIEGESSEPSDVNPEKESDITESSEGKESDITEGESAGEPSDVEPDKESQIKGEALQPPITSMQPEYLDIPPLHKLRPTKRHGLEVERPYVGPRAPKRRCLPASQNVEWESSTSYYTSSSRVPMHLSNQASLRWEPSPDTTSCGDGVVLSPGHGLTQRRVEMPGHGLTQRVEMPGHGLTQPRVEMPGHGLTQGVEMPGHGLTQRVEMPGLTQRRVEMPGHGLTQRVEMPVLFKFEFYCLKTSPKLSITRIENPSDSLQKTDIFLESLDIEAVLELGPVSESPSLVQKKRSAADEPEHGSRPNKRHMAATDQLDSSATSCQKSLNIIPRSVAITPTFVKRRLRRKSQVIENIVVLMPSVGLEY